MRQRALSVLLLLLLLAGSLPASGQPQGEPVTNREPIANAGADVTAGEDEAVFLDPRQSTDLDVEDRQNLDYRWFLLSITPRMYDPDMFGNRYGDAEYMPSPAPVDHWTIIDLTDAPDHPGDNIDPDGDGVADTDADGLPDPPTVAEVGKKYAYQQNQPGGRNRQFLTLEVVDDGRLCFVTPRLPVGVANSISFEFLLEVLDGNEYPDDRDGWRRLPNGDWVEAPEEMPLRRNRDTVRVTVTNTDGPPHGGLPSTPATCEEPSQPSSIELDILPEDVDCLADHGGYFLFSVGAFGDGAIDDTRIAGGTLRIRTPTGAVRTLPMEVGFKGPAGDPHQGEREYQLGALLPVNAPWLVHGTYRVDAVVFDESGQTANTGEQEAEITVACRYEDTFLFRLRLVGHDLQDSTQKATCFRAADRAPTETRWPSVALGPNAILRVEPNFTLAEGARAPEEVVVPEGEVEGPYPNPPPLIPITPLLLSRLTFQVCVGEGNARVLGPEIELPDPWALDLGSLPLGAQELVFRGTSRDGRTEMLLVRLTADEQPPEVLVVVPPVTHFGVPFDIQVLTHDTLAVEVRLEMPGVDLDQVAAGQQPRILRSSTTAPAPLEIPSLADAIRRQLPTVVDGKRVFDNVQEFLYDTNGDGIPEGYYDMQNQVRRPFARRDCTADGVQDLIVDLGPNGAPDGRLCQEGDLVLQVLRCGAAGAVSSLLVDHNRNGRCDKGVVLPSGKTADEYYLGLINPDGTLEPRFLAGGAGDPAIRAFLQAGPTTVFTYSVLRTGGVGDCDGDGVDDVFVDRELDQDKRGACQEGERFVKGEAGMDRRALLEAAIPQLALAGFRIRAQDAAGNAIEFQPQQALTVDPGVSQYQLAPNLHYVGPWPASFVAGIKVVVGDKEWAVVPGAPVGDQVRIDAVNRTLALGRALPAGTKVTVTYPTQVETVLASADLRLVGAAVEGREPRLFRDEGGRMVPDEAPLKAPRSATDPRLVFLPGDVVRFNATVEQQGGINAVPFTVLVNGRPFGQCADPANRTLDPIPPGKQSIVCSLGTFPPGVHTVRVQAVTDPLWVETDPNDQVTEVTFEVYAGVVRYTPAGANAPREFFIRARDNGLVRLEGGAIDLEADRSYDLRLEEEFVIRDGKGRSRTLAVYAFDYEQTRRFQGKQESMTVTLYWDPLERCDIRHIGLCGPDPKDFAKSDNGDCLATEVCRAVTVVPTVKFPVAEDRDSPGAGILVLLLLAGLAAYRRRRS